MSAPLPEFVVSLAERFDLSFKEPPETAEAVAAERECNLLLAALKEAMDEQAANQRVHNEEVQRADQWLGRVNKAPKERETWIRDMLTHVAPFVPRFGKKSRDLPHGVIGWRRNPERLTVDDAEAATAWAKSVGLSTETTESVRHRLLVEEWKATRAADPSFVPPGCRVIEAEEVFTAEAKDVG